MLHEPPYKPSRISGRQLVTTICSRDSMLQKRSWPMFLLSLPWPILRRRSVKFRVISSLVLSDVFLHVRHNRPAAICALALTPDKGGALWPVIQLAPLWRIAVDGKSMQPQRQPELNITEYTTSFAISIATEVLFVILNQPELQIPVLLCCWLHAEEFFPCMQPVHWKLLKSHSFLQAQVFSWWPSPVMEYLKLLSLDCEQIRNPSVIEGLRF